MTTRTALTGFIVPKCKIYGNGFFVKDPNDPDEFNEYMKDLKKELYDPTIKAKKDSINLIKHDKLKKFEKKEFEKRDGLIVIHRRYNILKNKDDNTIAIGARNPSRLDYQRSYRNEQGVRVNEQGLVIIKRRKERPKKDGLFIICKSKYNKNTTNKKLVHVHRISK